MQQRPLPDVTEKAAPGLSRAHFITLVASMMALNALAIDVILPAFPSLAHAFEVKSATDVQFVLLAYVVGFGAAQLVYGPVSDRYGRRAPLFAGLVIYVVFAIAGMFAPSFGILLAARFLQGVGAAGTRVIALALVRDTYSGRAMASMMSLVMMVFMAVPIVAPIVGQVLVLAGDWYMIFAFMAVAGAVMLVWCLKFLPETLPLEKRRALTLKSVGEAFRLTLTNRIALFYALSTAIFFGSLFSYLNMAQPLYSDVYGLGAYFPIAFGVTAILMALSSYANSLLVIRFGQRRLSHGALAVFLVLGSVLTVFAWSGNPPLWLFMLLLALMLPMIGLIAANLNSIALEPLGSVAGTASAVLGFFQTAGGGMTGTVIGQFYDGQVRTLSIGFMAVSALSLVFVAIAEKGRLFGVGEPDAA